MGVHAVDHLLHQFASPDPVCLFPAPPTPWLLPWLPCRLGEFSGDMLGHLLRAFGDMGYYDDELLEGVVSHVAAHPDKFSAENIADVVREGAVGAGKRSRGEGSWGWALAAPPHAPLRLCSPFRGHGCACNRLFPWMPCPVPPQSSLQVYAFSRCGFCHPDLITVVETAAGTLLKEAAADRGYVRCFPPHLSSPSPLPPFSLAFRPLPR